ncbi:MAG: SIMPL domain-containing protein [Anaerolineae bacterium]|nr:SIMPL domain-containing protein [Anaerolineae bacterium]MDW8100260.1 SIMPL domain-containing protein [Anaerolineae bacterium]
MSRKIGFTLTLSLVLLSATLGGLAFASSPRETKAQSTSSTNVNRTITVIGQGRVHVRPDIAQAQIGVEVFAPTVKEATAKNREQMTAVLAALRKAGIADRDIQTSNYSIFFEREPGIPMPATAEGIPGELQGRYRVSNMVQVTIRDLDAVASVLDAAIEAGANNIWGVNFSLEDSSAAESEARAKAMANARAKATELAELAGLKLGEVVSISESISSPYPVMAFAAMERIGVGGSGPISPGELDFQASLQVVFEVQ